MAEGTERVRVSDKEFFRINEEVAKSDNPSVEEVAKRTGLKPGSVTQRRNLFNRTFKDQGLVLTAFPRGGGARKDIKAVAAELIAMRDEMQKQEQEEGEEVSNNSAE